MPHVSIIIAAFNAGKTIRKAIRSAQQQTISDIEIFIVDDASTDDTSGIANTVAQEDHRIRLLTMSSNGGPGAARNLGIDHAKGTWIATLDADDWFETNRLEVLLEVAQSLCLDLVGDNVKLYDPVFQQVLLETAFLSRTKAVSLTAELLFKRDHLFRWYPIGYVNPIISRGFLI